MYEIAQRTMSLQTQPPREVSVTIGLPYEEPTGEWSCPYRIDGLDGWEHERKVTGIDSLQAVELVLVVVRSALAGSHEAREGLVAWDVETAGKGPQTVYASWDRENNVAYIAMKPEMAAGEAARQEVIGDVVLDFTESGELLGVELLDAVKLMPSQMRL